MIRTPTSMLALARLKRIAADVVTMDRFDDLDRWISKLQSARAEYTRATRREKKGELKHAERRETSDLSARHEG